MGLNKNAQWAKRKKRLRKKRRLNRRIKAGQRPPTYRIIPDTNIWYLLGRDNDVFEKVKDNTICPNYVNITELSNTGNLVIKEDSTRNAIRKMFHFQKHTIFEPPFVHVAQLVNKYTFNIQGIMNMLRLTSIFAQGDRIDDAKKEEFFNYIASYNEGFKEAATFFNEEAKQIRQRIKDKKSHRKKDSIQITAGFINFCVETSTKKQCNIDGIDFKKIELLVLTMDTFFKTMELSKMNMKPNDWFDLAILAYVRPGDKFWTEDNRLIQMIKEAGCEHYLYKP